MRRVMVRYRVTSERAAENEALIAAVFEQLARERPEGLRYASYKLADGVTFVHLASIEHPDRNPLRELAAFRAFIAAIDDRCEDRPVSVDLTEIGSYGSDR